MANLSPAVRDKAIEIANALLSKGYEEGKAIRIAIAQARRWADHIDASSQSHARIYLDGYGNSTDWGHG